MEFVMRSKNGGYKRQGDIQPHDHLLICDRSGFAINIRDAVRDGRYPQLTVHKDFWCPPDMYEHQVIPPPESIPVPARPDVLQSMPLFYYVNSVGSVFSQNKILPNLPYATATQIANNTPSVTAATFNTNDLIPVNTVIGTVAVNIPNGSPYVTTITAGNTNDDIAINSSGVLSAAKQLDHTRTSQYNLTVTATNASPGSNLTASATEVINVSAGDTSSLILALIPAVYLELEETSGTTLTDSSTNANNFTLLTGSQSYTYANAKLFPNLPGESIYEATAGFGSSANTIADYVFTNKLSGLIFVKPAVSAGANITYAAELMSRSTPGHRVFQFGTFGTTLVDNTHQRVGLLLTSASDETTVASASFFKLTATEWNQAHMFAFTYDGDNQTVKLYWNGQPMTVTNAPAGNFFTNGANITISGSIPTSLNPVGTGVVPQPKVQVGNATSTSEMNNWFGDMAHGALFAKVLTDADILAIWESCQ